MIITHSTAADGTFSAEGAAAWNAVHVVAGVPEWVELEIDFGSTPVYDATFQITDAAIAGTSIVSIAPSGKAATGRAAGDMQWDGATYSAVPGSGVAVCYAVFHPGPIVGRRVINYQVG